MLQYIQKSSATAKLKLQYERFTPSQHHIFVLVRPEDFSMPSLIMITGNVFSYQAYGKPL